MSSQYFDAKNWLFAKLPMFQNVGKTAFKGGIYNIVEICKAFGNPHLKFESIHIAGTNGKGSTCSLMASALMENGYKTGLTLSPHMLDFRERLTINGQMCSEDFVVEFVNELQQKLPNFEASFFEVMIAMGFLFFAQEKVDIAVVETGMGGRLDSTNILEPSLSIITNISMDHMAYLGDTRAKIAAEKAGIIKKSTPVLIGEKDDETESVFRSFAEKNQSPIFFAADLPQITLETDLGGSYQKQNTQIAWHALQTVWNKKMDPDKTKLGFLKVKKNTGLRGRWECIKQNPKTIIDAGHNKAAMLITAEQLKKEDYEELHLVLGFVNDKDVAAILQLLPENAYYYFCAPSLNRKFPVEQIPSILTNDIKYELFPTVKEAYEAAQYAAKADDFIFVGGSSFVVADLLSFLEEKICPK